MRNEIVFDMIPGIPTYIEIDCKTEKELENSHYKIKIDLINNRLIPNPMECRGAIGIYDLTKDEYTLHCSSQGVHSLKKKISKIK